MRVQIDGDLITGVVSGDLPGIDVPVSMEAIPTERMRFNGQVFIDISEVSQFYIDQDGVKHLLRLDPSWPRVTSAWDAELRNDGGVWVPVTPDQALRESLFAYAAARRWQEETAGITLDGLFVPTDERTQGVLTGAYARARADGEYAIDKWKVGPGQYVALSNEQIITIAEVVADHVQSCFDKNAEADDMIGAGEITTTAQIDALFEAAPEPDPEAA